MDGIQPYGAGARPLVAHVHSPTPPPSSAVKSPSDYLRAIRRRVWLALAIAIPVASAGTLYVLRMPPVYAVSSTIEIKPPKVDPAVASLVTHGEVGRGDPSADEKYVPDTLALLNSKSLLTEVFQDPKLTLTDAELEADPAAELAGKVKTREFPRSHLVSVSIEGRDPARITEILKVLLRKFQQKTHDASRDGAQNAYDNASTTRKKYAADLEVVQNEIAAHINKTTLAPGGRSTTEAQYDSLMGRVDHLRNQVGSLRNDQLIKSAMPGLAAGMEPSRAQAIEMLKKEVKLLEKRKYAAERIARDKSDPAILRASSEIKDAKEELAQLQDVPAQPLGISPAEVAERLVSEGELAVQVAEAQAETKLRDLKSEFPLYQHYVKLVGDRDLKAKQLADLTEKLSEFKMLIDTQKPPVKVVDEADEPTVPLRPNKPLYIGAGIVLAIGLGLGLVCFLEHIDHSVKVPEHLTAGLALPLFGVVPRMRRLARNHRGGHLWTPGIPESVEADAYRNLRASLLGATSEDRPIITLLITSAKAGEGKSTTALNLAATCARAGERTLLMDVDLRRPSLVDVFTGHGDGTGLVDVLRGDLPWQRTVVQTDLPNLDFLPTGETRDVPIEVLGSLELRQLLISLSQHHYDRVILDGPAILGLADCRMLGRIVDAALLVVRSGSQELRPLQRAKAMLEQSMVRIAGVVFNGLNEDMENWSSYGPSPMLESSTELAGRSPVYDPRGLDSRGRKAALMAAAPARA